jgi:glycosyltransferase involved in cell wall biosynthesis
MLELVRKKHNLLIAPRSPIGPQVTQAEAASLQPYCRYQPLLSWKIFQASILELIRTPIKCLRLFLRILFGSGKPLHLLKNFAVFPKALWLGRLARKWGAEHIHAHWAQTTATMAMIAGEMTGIPWSFTAHRGDIVGNNMLWKKVQSTTFVRFISHSGLGLAKTILNSKHLAKCHMIHMGVDLTDVQLPKKKVIEKPFTIMCPANLVDVKGHVYLLQAFAELEKRGASCQLLLAGQGPLLKELRRQVNKFQIQEMVKFLGHLPHSDLFQYYKRNEVDLVVIPSIDLGNGHHEGIPVSLMEAMAHGIPVIATPTGGIPELLSEGTGILVPPKDSKALANAIQKLITDSALRRNLAIAGYNRVLENFNVKTTMKSLCLLMGLESN